MVLSISYNPYLLESSFRVNGKSANKTPWAQYLRRRRLQTWFDLAPNWKGFAVEIQNALNEREVEIEFTGREIDYRDLQLFCDQWNSQSGKDHKTRFVLSAQKDVYKRQAQKGTAVWRLSKKERRKKTNSEIRVFWQDLCRYVGSGQDVSPVQLSLIHI